MHPHLIDWFRNVEIHPEPKVVEQRWKTADAFSKTLTRSSAVRLLRMFLFEQVDSEHVQWLTAALLEHDKEFPVAGNAELLRLMAGVVMVTTFRGSSVEANAFALGLRAANYPSRALSPAHPAILSEAEAYLSIESSRVRPVTFDETPPSIESALASKFKEVNDATEAADTAKIQAAYASYHAAIANAIQAGPKLLAAQIRRLAEETGLLWWVVGEYSTALCRGTSTLDVAAYAIVAGAEAAQRTHILPPPPSAEALLQRALRPCKRTADTKAPLENYLTATDEAWITAHLKTLHLVDCMDLLPVTAALAKKHEFGVSSTAIQVLPRLCPGVITNEALPPAPIAVQTYSELMFLQALLKFRR